jgi:hypothetical protein
MGNGGYIAKFEDEDYVNLSAECSALSKKFSNLWILLIFDACTVAQNVGPRTDFTGAAAVATYKTVTLSACRLGQKAYNQWNFTKSFADFVVQKVEANNGNFRIPVDLFSFKGPNGERELSFGLTDENFITLKFPIAAPPQPKPLPVKQPASLNTHKIEIAGPTQSAPKNYVFTYTTNVAEQPSKQDQEHPVKGKLNWTNPLNGVIAYDDLSYQFISLNRTRSKFKDSDCWGK